jgi:hypothetical protein
MSSTEIVLMNIRVQALVAAPLLALCAGAFAQTPPPAGERAQQSCQAHPEACAQVKQVAPQVKAGAEAACAENPAKCQQEKAQIEEHHGAAKARREQRGAAVPQ